MLFMDLAPNQEVRIGDSIIKLVHKSGQRARLQIDADPFVKVEKVTQSTKDSKKPS